MRFAISYDQYNRAYNHIIQKIMVVKKIIYKLYRIVEQMLIPNLEHSFEKFYD